MTLWFKFETKEVELTSLLHLYNLCHVTEVLKQWNKFIKALYINISEFWALYIMQNDALEIFYYLYEVKNVNIKPFEKISKCPFNEGKIDMETLKKFNCNIYYYEMKRDAIGQD